MFKTILLAYDGSDHAQNALATAAQLAVSLNAKLHIVHTPQMDTPPIVIGSYVSMIEVPPSREEIAEAGTLIADQARSKAKEHGVDPVDVHVASGTPARDVLAAAEKIDADLIVMGRRGLGTLGALTLGSVSQSVAHNAKCACMTVI